MTPTTWSQTSGVRSSKAAAEQTGIVDDDVDPTHVGGRGADERVRAGLRGDIPGVRDGAASRGDDLIDDRAGSPGVEVVDDHGRATSGEQPRMSGDRFRCRRR